jgi:hypothetical protein
MSKLFKQKKVIYTLENTGADFSSYNGIYTTEIPIKKTFLPVTRTVHKTKKLNIKEQTTHEKSYYHVLCGQKTIHNASCSYKTSKHLQYCLKILEHTELPTSVTRNA